MRYDSDEWREMLGAERVSVDEADETNEANEADETGESSDVIQSAGLLDPEFQEAVDAETLRFMRGSLGLLVSNAEALGRARANGVAGQAEQLLGEIETTTRSIENTLAHALRMNRNKDRRAA